MPQKILNSNKVLELKNVCFGYDQNKLILNNISFSIKENEYICVIGQNGCGKSTAAMIMTGMLKPQSGEIKILSQTVNKNNFKLLKKNIGVIFQNPDAQFIGSIVEDDIAFSLENKNIDPKVMPEIIKKVAKIVGIESLLKRPTVTLSGGQKQKVAIASILAMDPKIIIFDEATSMLDPFDKKSIKDLILILKNKYHKTVISITHDMEETLNADRVIVMHKGTISLVDKPSNIFKSQSRLYALSLDYPFIYKLVNYLKDFNVDLKQNEFQQLMKEMGYEE